MAKESHNVYATLGGSDLTTKLKVGAVYAHEKGDGFNIVLNANPIDGRLVLFPADENESKRSESKTRR